MIRYALLLVSVVAPYPAWGETVDDVINAGIALSEAYKGSMRAQAEADRLAQENKMYWTCSCVGGNPVYGFKSLRQLRAENGGRAERSQMLFEINPQMSLPLNTLLSTLCK